MADGAEASLASQPNRSLRDFEIGRPLGKGHFGKVYLARLKSSDYIVALKCLSRTAVEADPKNMQQAEREIAIMQGLRHPNIVRLYDYFADGDYLVLMLEFVAQGELFRQLAKKGRFSERRSVKYIRQVADALCYLHARDVIHRDIKPENLFIGLDGEVKIGDFGWSVHSPAGAQRTLCGTLSYVAPEMVLNQPHGRGVDVWALGVLAYEFVVGAEPFGADTTNGPRLVHQRICRCDVRFPDEYPSSGARDFIMSLLRLNPEDRMPLEAVPQHPWIVSPPSSRSRGP